VNVFNYVHELVMNLNEVSHLFGRSFTKEYDASVLGVLCCTALNLTTTRRYSLLLGDLSRGTSASAYVRIFICLKIRV
jgi:hypothetical protein